MKLNDSAGIQPLVRRMSLFSGVKEYSGVAATATVPGKVAPLPMEGLRGGDTKDAKGDGDRDKDRDKGKGGQIGRSRSSSDGDEKEDDPLAEGADIETGLNPTQKAKREKDKNTE